MIISNAFLLDFLSNFASGVLLLSCTEIIIDDPHFPFSRGMPILDNLHSLCDIVIEREDFFKLANKRGEEIIIALESDAAQCDVTLLAIH